MFAPGGPWPGGNGGGPEIVSDNDEKEKDKHYPQRVLEAVHSYQEEESQEAAYHYPETVVLQESRVLQVEKADEL